MEISEKEKNRLQSHYNSRKNWLKWGPYLSERQWGTVREDDSPDGSAWDFFPHDHARSRVYRWGEDGIAGISDEFCNLCFAPALLDENEFSSRNGIRSLSKIHEKPYAVKIDDVDVLYTIMIHYTRIQINAQETRAAEEAKGLEVGVQAPDFRAKDAYGKEFQLDSVLKSSPVVIIFYRGHWCPVCNKHLGVIQDSLQLITDKGATVVAVSPQNPEFLDKMAGKTGATFRLLYDEGYAISDAYDVTFTPENKELIVYNTVLNAQLKKSQSDNSQRLPIPATYIIGQDGVIVWRQFDPDYKNRSTVKEILANLP